MSKKPIIFSLFATDILTRSIQEQCNYELGILTLHQFPDEETLIRYEVDVTGREVLIVCGLDRPDAKLLPLVFAAETARSLGALSVGLIAPYLPYMRQDKVFQPGQGITSYYFAQLVSRYFDRLLTVDPHLHRYADLNAIYTIPADVVHASNAIGQWIHQHVQQPVLIGPDAESRQWVSAIANKANAPFVILEKKRMGDRSVAVSIPDFGRYKTFMPVLVDDIISSGKTMIETVHHLQSLNMLAPVCIGVHAVFAESAYQQLLASGVKQVVTCNTITHCSNSIDISAELVSLLSTL